MGGRCLILDFDGTILDTEEPVYRSWAELWEAHGHELELTEWQRIIGTNAGFDPWAELERRVGGALDPHLATQRRARRDELQARHEPRPGVLAWLAEAQELQIPVGIASSSPPDWVEDHLARLGLREHFACVVCCTDDMPAKPDPRSYREACQRLDADPTRSIAVEDSPHGVTAAVAAGLFAIAVPHPLTAGLDFSAAHLVVTSLADLTLRETMAKLPT